MSFLSRRTLGTVALLIPFLMGLWIATTATTYAQEPTIEEELIELGLEECFYIVQPGDTLAKIAAANDTTVAAILDLNPEITNPNLIEVGQLILLPGCFEDWEDWEDWEGSEDWEDWEDWEYELIEIPAPPADLPDALWRPIHDATFNIRYPVDDPYVGGTGVMVGLDGKTFLTAFHVVANWETEEDYFDYTTTVELGPFQEWRYTADVIDILPIEDLALLQVNEWDFPGFAVAPLGTSTTLVEGDPIYTISYPMAGTELQTGKGTFLEKYYDWWYGTNIIVTDAWATFGSSGGVAVNGDGEVIGIITAGIIGQEAVEYFGYTGTDQLTLIVPIEAAYPLFWNNGISTPRHARIPR